MNLYADTSLLVSYYITDVNSARAQALIHSTPNALLFTGLHRLELRTAFELGVFRKVLTPAQSRAAWKAVEQDLKAGRLLAHALNWVPVFRVAAQLATRHAASFGCRSLDILHVALAEKIKAPEFYSFDTRQRGLAQSVGLAVRP